MNDPMNPTVTPVDPKTLPGGAPWSPEDPRAFTPKVVVRPTQVIVYTNPDNGLVSICIPTGEIPVEDVQKKDVPATITSHIIEGSELPHTDWDFHPAWTLNVDATGKPSVTVDLTKARAHASQQLDLLATEVANRRHAANLVNAAGALSVASLLTSVAAARTAVAAATSTSDLRAALAQIPTS